MRVWNQPPRIKILEALSLQSRNHVKTLTSDSAIINGVNVFFNREQNGICIEDEESIRKGYIGSEGLCFLMKKGILPYNKKIGELLKDFNWSYYSYNNYAEGEKAAKKILFEKGVDEKLIDAYIDRINSLIRKHSFRIIYPEKKQSKLLAFE